MLIRQFPRPPWRATKGAHVQPPLTRFDPSKWANPAVPGRRPVLDSACRGGLNTETDMTKLGLLSAVVGAMVLAATPVSLRLPSNETSALSVDTAAAQTTPTPSAAPAATGTYGMQRRHERRTQRYERRDERRDDR